MKALWQNKDGGQVEVEEFWFDSECGFESGSGEMVLVAESFQMLKRCGDVSFVPSEGDTFKDSLVLSGLYVDSYERLDGENGSLYKVKIVDRRSWWSYRKGDFKANICREDGLYDRASLDGGAPYTWRRIIEVLFSALGETVANLNSLPESPMPIFGINWRNVRVIDGLKWLLSSCGFTVALRYDGGVLVVKVGEQFSTSSSENGFVEEKIERQFLKKPDVVEFVGAPILVWRKEELEPIALDTDGTIKSISDVSYLQGKDVGLELACDFASLEGNVTQNLARASVGRMFRMASKKGILPILMCDYYGKNARLTGRTFISAKKRGFINIEGFEHSFRIVDSEGGIVKTDRVCGHLTQEEIDCLPCVIDGEPVRVEIEAPLIEYPTYKRDAEGKVVFWKRRYGAFHQSQGRAAILVPVPWARVVEGSSSQNLERFYESVTSKIAGAILSLPDSVEVLKRTYIGARGFTPDGRIGRIKWVYKDGLAYTETSTGGHLSEHLETLLESLLGTGYGFEHSDRDSLLDYPFSFTRRLNNANKAGVLPIVSEAQEESPYEARLFGRLVSYDEENSLPELKDVLPVEAQNFCVRRHKTSGLVPENGAQDEVWALRLLSDDKHRIESAMNRSTPVMRLCDGKEGDIDDIWRVRAVPSGGDVSEGMEQASSPTYVPVVSSNQAYRLMWLINTLIGGEGGWITDVPPEGLGLMTRDGVKRIAPPRHIGQIGNIVVLTDDDLICITSDRDAFVLANIRHDAHFHLDREHDGRIYFTANTPGVRSGGVKYIGEMVCDPALANQNTELKLESGEWCPQISLGISEYLYNIFPPCDCGG